MHKIQTRSSFISQSASQGFGSRMRTPVLVPGVFLLSAAIWQQTRAPDCCPTKTVKDASEEDSHLNGVYTLKAKMDSKPSPECVDGCVYMRDNQEYCFIEKPGATAVCEVSTLFLLHCFSRSDFGLSVYGSATFLLWQCLSF